MHWSLYLVGCVVLILVLIDLNLRRKFNKVRRISADGDFPTQFPSMEDPLYALVKGMWLMFSGQLQGDGLIKQQKELLAKATTDVKKLKSTQGWFFTGQTITTWNPKIVKEVLFNKNGQFGKVSFGEISEKFFGQSVLIVEGDVWKRQRNVLSPSFSFEHLKSLVPSVHKMSTRFIEELNSQCFSGNEEEETSAPIHPHEWMQRLTLDILGEAGFGKQFNALDKEISESRKNYEDLMLELRNPIHFFEKLDKILGSKKKMDDLMAKFQDWVLEIVQEKRQKINEKGEDYEPSDLLDLLVLSHTGSDYDQLSDQEIIHNVNVFFIAGHETTAGALASTMHLLAENTDCQNKARKEISELLEKKKLSSPTELSYDDLAELKYTTWCLKEALRLLPPAFGSLRKALRDTEVYGYTLPKDAMVFLNFFIMHMDPELFPEPERFIPERFSPEEKAKMVPNSYTPFSIGPRQCIGNNFAMMEMRAVLATLLHNYELQAVPGAELKLHLGTVLCPAPTCSIRLAKL